MPVVQIVAVDLQVVVIINVLSSRSPLLDISCYPSGLYASVILTSVEFRPSGIYTPVISAARPSNIRK